MPLKIAFIQFVYYEYLGVMYLSSCLKKNGHKVEVFICQGWRDTEAFVDEIAEYRPDIAGFSIMTGSEDAALEVARRIKARMQVYCIFGGPHPTFVPDIITNECVDCVCIGEAEHSLVSIAERLAAGESPEKTAGAWFKGDGKIIRNDIAELVNDLDSLPRPDRSLYRDKYKSMRSRRAGFILGRGCPFHCSFCANMALEKLYRGKGNYVRQRSVSEVIGEMKDVKKDYNIKTVYIRDDTFIINKDWVLEFCEAYRREIGLPFACHIRAESASEEVISALSSANCRTVSFGVETGSPDTRSLLLKKGVTDEQIIECARLLKKYGIRFRTFNMLGLPGETIDDAFGTVDINVRIGTDYPWCALFQPMPATELWEYCKTNNMFEAGSGSVQPSSFHDSPLALRNKNEIVNLQKLFFYAVRFPALRRPIRALVRIRPNLFYNLLFMFAHAWIYYNNDLVSFRDLLNVGFRNISRYLSPAGAGEGSRQGAAMRKYAP